MVRTVTPRAFRKQRVDRRRERLGGQRAARDDRWNAGVDRAHFIAHDADARVPCEPAFDALREEVAVDRKRATGRNGGFARARHDQRIQPSQFFFEQADRILESGAAQRIAAHELGEPIGLMRRSANVRAHLVQLDLETALRRLPRGLAPREARTDHAQDGNRH